MHMGFIQFSAVTKNVTVGMHNTPIRGNAFSYVTVLVLSCALSYIRNTAVVQSMYFLNCSTASKSVTTTACLIVHSVVVPSFLR